MRTSCITGDAGFFVFIGALLASRPMSDAAAASKTASASVALTLFPKERPLASEAKDWCDDAKPLLPADQRALIDGLCTAQQRERLLVSVRERG